ncbi:MAG: hypothetical protein IJV83_00075 [Clostridia bacterium]|nr:hypothetical protein [Clostridia bacterium]
MGLRELFGKSKSKTKKRTSSKSSAPKRTKAKTGSKNKTPSKSSKGKKRKNVSPTIPNGRTVQTRDEFFFGQKNYRKPGYEKKGNYRKAVVVDSNKKNELALVKLTTSEAGKSIPGSKKSKYRPFVETKDNEGQPIKLGKKFIPNPPKSDLSMHAVSEIKKDAFRDSKKAKKNRSKVRELKEREKK